MPSHNALQCVFVGTELSGRRIHWPVKCHTELNVVIYKEPSGAQKSPRSHFGAVRGFCGFKRLRWCALTLGVLYGAFKSSAWALSASHTAERDKTEPSLPTTTAALKEIPGWFLGRRGLEVTVAGLLCRNVFDVGHWSWIFACYFFTLLQFFWRKHRLYCC